MLQLYKVFVRLHLKCSMLFQLPSYRNAVIKLEKVQQRFKRMLMGLEGLCYKERLHRSGLSFSEAEG